MKSQTVGHFHRKAKKQQLHESVRLNAERMVLDYFAKHEPTQKNHKSHYRSINEQLAQKYSSYDGFRLARQGFLRAVRSYNDKLALSGAVGLDEPVVPLLIGRENLTIGYDWFVRGSMVSEQEQTMMGIWLRKRKYTTKDCVEFFIYSSIMYGGLNDVAALKSLYDWLITQRTLYQLNTQDAKRPLLVIPLAVEDESYGTQTSDEGMVRHVNYVPDDMSLCFLYALKDKTLSAVQLPKFHTLINQISKRLALQNKKADYPELSYLLRYANFHWQLQPDVYIDNALVQVMQRRVRTTALNLKKLKDYFRCDFNNKLRHGDVTLVWQDLLNRHLGTQTDDASENTATKKHTSYPAFSKNIIKQTQDSLKGSKKHAKASINSLLSEHTQPNAQRLLAWTLSMIESGHSNLNSISKYIGCIGRDWLMLTMDEDLKSWDGEDYEAIYEQIIISKIKDGREVPLLKKDDDFGMADDELVDLYSSNNSALLAGDHQTDDTGIADAEYLPSHKTEEEKRSILDELRNSQKFTYGRLRAFHDFQVLAYGAPYVYFAWVNGRQLVKANMVSPNLYRAMQARIQDAQMDTSQKRLCLVSLALAYRAGFRINELAGVQCSDIETPRKPVIVIQKNPYRSLKSSSARRSIPVYCLLKRNELSAFLDLLNEQTRLKRKYLFSTGSGSQPLSDMFFRQMTRLLWDELLGEHDLTFHSLRHTAISQLAVVLSGAELAQVFTDYSKQECHNITKGLLGHNQAQGRWFGLASLAGHLTCDTTFEYYLHTAHLLAGWQLSQAKLRLPLNLLEQLASIDYQKVHYHDKHAYCKKTKTVELGCIRHVLIKGLNVEWLQPNTQKTDGLECSLQQKNDDKEVASSIFIHAKYDDAIALLQEVQKLPIEHQQKIKYIEPLALRHGVRIKNANLMVTNASKSFDDNRLLYGSPRGQKTLSY